MLPPALAGNHPGGCIRPLEALASHGPEFQFPSKRRRSERVEGPSADLARGSYACSEIESEQF